MNNSPVFPYTNSTLADIENTENTGGVGKYESNGDCAEDRRMRYNRTKP